MIFRILFDVSLADQFSTECLPVGTFVFLSDIVSRKTVVPPFENLLVLAAEKHVHNVVDADAESTGLLNAKDARHEFLSGNGPVDRLRVLAIIAVTAVAVWPFFGKVGEKRFAATFGRFGIMDHLP